MTNTEYDDERKVPTDKVDDDAEKDTTVVPVKYEITSYGADLDVEGLVKRIQRDDIFIPTFQRDYVWNQQEASRFIESLLLGLPVPGVFMARERESNRLLVIDGQQRLKSLQFYFEGFFNPKHNSSSRKVFKLIKVQRQFDGKTFEELSDRDKLILRDTLIHATIVKQESPDDDDTSVYHIFERLNNGGRRLTPQEIRSAIYHGPFIHVLKELNEYSAWRTIFGPRNIHLKDEELILRFLALYFDGPGYVRPMKEFLNKFAEKTKNAPQSLLDHATVVFTRAIDAMEATMGLKSFRPERPLNAAVFDSVMVGLAKRLWKDAEIDHEHLFSAYQDLLENPEYQKAIRQATSNEISVYTRIKEATEAFAGI